LILFKKNWKNEDQQYEIEQESGDFDDLIKTVNTSLGKAFIT
jgi:hypothetical protein